MVKVFYNSNAAMEDWASIELPEVCPLAVRQLIDDCNATDPQARPNIDSVLERLHMVQHWNMPLVNTLTT